MSPGGAGEPGPNPELDGKNLASAQNMIAGYSNAKEAIEGGQKIFGQYNITAGDLASVKAHQIIQKTLLENAAQYRIPLNELRVAPVSAMAQAAATAITKDGQLVAHKIGINTEFFQRGFKDVRKEGSMWNLSYGVAGVSKNPRKTILDHEFAHVLQRRQLGAKGMETMRQSKALYKPSRSVSKYSTHNRLEEHAEAFAAHKMGMRSRRIDRILRSLKSDS